MAFQLILGSSGQGKTRYLMEEVIRASMQHPEQAYYILVPEQFGLEMQSQMVEMHPDHGFSNIDILSMHRLAYRVFDECAYKPQEILEDLGVSMILKKVLLEHEEELTYFKRSLHYPGFLDELKSMLMEFMNYGVSFSDLDKVSEDLDSHPGLREKCQECARIFRWFQERIRDQYMVSGQILERLKDFVPDSRMLQQGVFYLDGYTGFTPIQLDFLRELLPAARDVYVTVTIPYIPAGSRKQAREDLFSFSEKTIHALWKLCSESGTEMREPVLLDHSPAPRYEQEGELSHLERYLFRRRSEVYEGTEPMQQIHAVTCENPEAEAEYVLHKIEELVRRYGYRYRDFAILMGNEEDYPSAFVRRSAAMQIPLFVDTRQKMSYHCGVELVRSLFHLLETNYSYESVFRYLKSGLSDMSGEDSDYLEHYIYSSGVRGLSMWSGPFTRRLYRYNEEEICRLERLREQLLSETAGFARAMGDKEASVKQKMTVLYETLRSLHVPEKLKKRAELAHEAAEYVKERNYQLFFKELLELMDKIVGIFGQETMEEKDLSALMDAGLETLALNSPPIAMDQVILGDLKRSRLPQIKVLFFVGMNDGDIPPVPEDRGLLCDEEKRILEEHGITLSLNLTERVLEDEFYMYLAFSKPSDQLWLSYSSMRADGSAGRPSVLFQSFRKMYPALKQISYPEDMVRYHFTEKDSREYLIARMRSWYEGRESGDATFTALLAYWQEEHPEELERIWQQMVAEISWMPLPEEIVEELYGKELLGSVTRLEKYASCPYQYFCDYGLRLEEWEEYKLMPVDLGNLFHAALKYFSNHVREEGYGWKDIPQELQERLLAESVDAVMDDGVRDVMSSTARNAYRKEMVHRILKRTVEVLRYHLRKSSFEPDQFEMHFGPEDSPQTAGISLSDGHRIAFQGVIDRVDLCEEGDCLYLKVIDYKSGTKKFDFNELYYGLQLQLILYLNAALEIYRRRSDKVVEPAAIFYYHIQDPMQKAEDATGDKKMNIFRMSGCANSDPLILSCLEQRDGDSMESFSLRINKDGSPRKGSSVMETADFHMVGEYARQTMKQIGERIYSGEIEARPYKYGDATACQYCPYLSVCGFEAGHAGHDYRSLQKLPQEELLKKIREEVE